MGKAAKAPETSHAFLRRGRFPAVSAAQTSGLAGQPITPNGGDTPIAPVSLGATRSISGLVSCPASEVRMTA